MYCATRKCEGCGCGVSGQNKRCEPCKLESKRARDRNARRQPRKSLPESKCQWCGVWYTPKAPDRDKYHSRECYFLHKKAKADAREEDRRRESIRLASGKAVADGYLRWANAWKPCNGGCGRLVFKGRAVCSSQCRGAITARRPSKHTHRCDECGAEFHSKSSQAMRCAGCRKKLANQRCEHRKRARKYGVAYEPISSKRVFARDGYVCGLCGQRTEPSKQVPHPRAPTLDHIVPISRGGPHTYDNVQCACFECNYTANAKSNPSPGGRSA